MPRPLLVNTLPRTVGSKITPVVVRYGRSVRTTLGLTTDEVAFTTSRCLPVRYSVLVMTTASGSGLTVTEVNSEAEGVPPALVAVMVSWTTADVTWPRGRIGAAKVTVAVQVEGAPAVQVTAPTVRLTSAGAPAWVTANVT